MHASKMGYLWQVMKMHGLLDLQTVLGITKAFEATDDRDKVFALVGLSHNADAEFIDYGKGLDRILLELAHCALASPLRGARDILAYTNIKSAQKAGVPSWVPALLYDEPDFHPLSSAFPGTELAPNSDLFGFGTLDVSQSPK